MATRKTPSKTPASDDPTDDPEAYAERLKSALWYHVGQLVDSEAIELEANATPQFIGALTELVWSQVENVSHDLESFAKHAGRQNINTQDVLLLARRNEGLQELMEEFVEKEKEKRGEEEGRKKGKGRK